MAQLIYGKMGDSFRAKQERIWDRVLEDYSLEDPEESAELLERAAAGLAEAVARVLSYLDQVHMRGRFALALCPFHMDKSVGSFQVNTRTGLFKCWSCQSSGGIYKLMGQLGLDPQQLTAAMKDVDFRVLTDFLEGRSKVKDGMMQIPEGILELYNKRPMHLVKKGHPRRLIDKLDIGFDERRMRITYPIRRITGELVAIQSRSVDPNIDKGKRWKFYRQEILDDVGPEAVDVFDLRTYEPPRSSVFFNEHNVLGGMLSGDLHRPVVLVEGPGHALRVMACGYPCIASFGVSLADGQLERLLTALARMRKWTGAKPVFLVATDGDRPGRMSAFKTALQMGEAVETRVARIPEGCDPEDLSVRDLRPLLLGAPLFTDYLLEDGDEGDWARDAVNKFASDAYEAEQRAKRKESWERRQQEKQRDHERPARLTFLGLPSRHKPRS